MISSEIEVQGMRFFRGDDGRAPFHTLALSDVRLPGLGATLVGVQLTWSRREGFQVRPPFKSNRMYGVKWYHDGPIAKDLLAKMEPMYLGMGGKVPDEDVERTGPNPVKTLLEIDRVLAS